MIVFHSYKAIALRRLLMRAGVCLLLATTLASYLRAQGVVPRPLPRRATVSPRVTRPDAEDPNAPIELKFNSATLDILLNAYSETTGKTMLLAPGLPSPSFSLRSQAPLTMEQYLEAIETVLTMHGVGLIHRDETFIQVVPINELTRDVSEIRETLDDTLSAPSTSEMVSQMIVLEHIEIPEAIKAIEPLRHSYGKIAAFERTNSILVTETVGNIRKILQVLRFVDQKIDIREESFRIQIKHAKAMEIKQKLEEIIKDAQEQNKRATAPTYRTTGAPGAIRSTTRITPGTIRSRVPVPSRTSSTASPAPPTTATADIERGAIQGNVKIVADERTNQLIFITRPENMPFFEKIIAVLDIETAPDVIIEVVRLEFATAKDVASMLNDLIGANADDVSTPEGDGATGDKVESKRISDVQRRQQGGGAGSTATSSVGELSKTNIKILSDERTNALIIMASRADQAVIRAIIADMDMMLSQVLIEVAILEIALSDSLQTGVDWIQRSLTAYRGGTGGDRSPTVSWAGGGGGGREAPIALTLPSAGSTLSTAGMRYYMSFFDLNLDVVVSMAASDGRSRVVSTPVLLTTDNTEAKLESTDRIYVYDGTTRRSDLNGGDFETYKQEDVGLKLEIKPHINVNNVVMLEITQELSQPNPNPPGDVDNLAGQLISRKRQIEASVAVSSGNTIVLGGQVREDNNRDRSKVPFLGDIPLLGRLFTYNARTKSRTETVVFMTPYVLDTPEKIEEESRRRRDALDVEGLWKQGWSNSRLADPPTPDSKWWPFGGKDAPAERTAPERMLPAGAEPVANGEPMPAELNVFLQEQEERWREAERRGGLRP